MEAPEKIYAVLTGDFIGFSGLAVSTRRRMPELLHMCGEELQAAFPGTMRRDIAVFRGDSWQALVDNPVRALRAALFIRAGIRAADTGGALDTRMAIGMGTVDYVPSGNISAGDGAAFRVSGRCLEIMGAANQGRLRFSWPDLPVETLLDAIVRMTGTLADNWSSRQARAVLGALQGRTQRQIAAGWTEPVSRQAIGKHLGRAGWPAISHGLSVFEDCIARQLAGPTGP